MLEYRAKISREGRYHLAEFRDCPGCQTFAETREELLVMAREALEGWLEAQLGGGEAPPRPRAKTGTAIGVSAKLAAVLQIRWARQDRGLSQTALAKLAGISQQQVARLENPDGNPTLNTLEKVAQALGLRLDLTLTAA